MNDSYKLGYEIVTYSKIRMTKERALERFKKDTEAHNMITNNYPERFKRNWKAIGAAMSRNFASVWFGEFEDPDGNLSLTKK